MNERSNWKLPGAATLLAGALVLGSSLGSRALSPPPEDTSEPASQRPIVVELFTSQGCSSCPSADRLLAELGKSGAKAADIIPLSFHVDYWNYIGWEDPFSDAQWSRRQERYAQARVSSRLYTPQAVIQGSEDCVGSSSTCLMKAIARAAQTIPAARLGGHLHRGDAGELWLDLRVHVDRNLGSLQALVIVFEKNLRTEVKAGENARRTLKNDFVVRSITPALTLAGREGEEAQRTLKLDLEGSWRPEELGVAVLLQDPKTMRIHAAWSRRRIPG